MVSNCIPKYGLFINTNAFSVALTEKFFKHCESVNSLFYTISWLVIILRICVCVCMCVCVGCVWFFFFNEKRLQQLRLLALLVTLVNS